MYSLMSGGTVFRHTNSPERRTTNVAIKGACNRAHHALSTKRRQTGILMDVHPVLRGITEASQLQLPRTATG